MTLSLDLSQPQTVFFVTSSGGTLDLFDKSSNVSSSFILTGSSSEFPDRYFKYEVSTDTLTGITEGTYKYTIGAASGLLKVVNEVLTPTQEVNANYIYVQESDSSDDYIVYRQ
jgi:hypothetical protein